MPQKCTICPHPNYAEMMSELKANVPRTAVAVRFGVDYTSLGRCWSEHRPHDQEYEVAEAIRRTQKALNQELKKKLKDRDRVLVKDLETRLKGLRAEQRELRAIKKEENPDPVDGGGPLTIAALDRIVANFEHSDVERLSHYIRMNVPANRQKELCRQLQAYVRNAIACEPPHRDVDTVNDAQDLLEMQ